MLIETTLDGSDQPVGSLAVGEGDAPTAFCGWLDLLAVLADAIGAAGDEQHQPGGDFCAAPSTADFDATPRLG